MTSSSILLACVYVVCRLMMSPAVEAVPSLDSFHKLARQLMECRRVPGLVVTVVDLGRRQSDGADPVVVHRNYGWADVDARRPMTTTTRVCIASLTKAFTSALLGIMLLNTTRHVFIASAQQC